MRDSGRTIQVQQLLGQPYVVWGKGRSLFGSLMLADDSDEPVAVVCYLKRPVEVPGLIIADVQPARHGMQRVTYVKADSLDPRPSLGPGQGC